MMTSTLGGGPLRCLTMMASRQQTNETSSGACLSPSPGSKKVFQNVRRCTYAQGPLQGSLCVRFDGVHSGTTAGIARGNGLPPCGHIARCWKLHAAARLWIDRWRDDFNTSFRELTGRRAKIIRRIAVGILNAGKAITPWQTVFIRKAFENGRRLLNQRAAALTGNQAIPRFISCTQWVFEAAVLTIAAGSIFEANLADSDRFACRIANVARR